MALRKPRTNSRLNTKSSQQGLTEREEDAVDRGGKLRKRKLSDIGPAWSKDDLEVFYQAYRKHGKDWKKVAGSMPKRTMEMVEAVYGMNRAYLSLPEGVASAAGLIAMMTDRYNIQDESGDESSEEFGTSDRSHQTQSQSRTRATSVSNANLGQSGYGGPSPAKKPRSAPATRPWGKRTPRYPIGNVLEQKGTKTEVVKTGQDQTSSDDNDVIREAEIVARALVTASQQVLSPVVAKYTPTRRHRGTNLQNGHAKEPTSKLESSGSLPKRSASTSGESPDGRHEKKDKSRRAPSGATLAEAELENGSKGHSSDEKSRWKKPSAKKLKLRNLDPKCDEAMEQSVLIVTHEEDAIDNSPEKQVSGQIKNKLSTQRTKKRSRQLFSGDKCSGALDALALVVEVTLNGNLPLPTVVPEASETEEEENSPQQLNLLCQASGDLTEKANEDKVKEEGQENGFDVEKLKESPPKDEAGPSNGPRQPSISPPDARKRKRKNATEKMIAPQGPAVSDDQGQIKAELEVAPIKVETPVVLKPRRKPKRIITGKAGSRQGGLKGNKVGDASSLILELPTQASVQSTDTDDGNLPLKLRTKKKGPVNGIGDGSTLAAPPEIVRETPHCPHATAELGPFNVKARLTHCLSPKVQRWSQYEWFYSAIDLPWFSRNEFVEYLSHAGLGHVPRLTRVEWGVIRSSLGKPRRLSKNFLREEREKLAIYRENVRRHYHELRTGLKDGLPSDLARPLTVGQRVIARHPKTKQIHDGSILTVDRSKCRVQFDRPELGVEFVLDIDAMPINRLENMSENMRRSWSMYDGMDRSLEDPKQARTEVSAEVAARAALNDRLERVGSSPSPVYHTSHLYINLMKTGPVNTLDAVRHSRAAINDAIAVTQQSLRTQPCTPTQCQTRESDIRLLLELGGALSTKESLIVELHRMNEESAVQKDTDVFHRQYEIVSQRLKEVNDKVSDALKHLRHRIKPESVIQPWHRSASQIVTGNLTPCTEGRLPIIEAGADCADISASAKKHARTMVSVAIQSMSSALKEGEDPLAKIKGALERIPRGIATNQTKPGVMSSLMTTTSTAAMTSSLRGASDRNIEDQSPGGDRRANRSLSGHASALTSSTEPTEVLARNAKEAQIVQELMASCVATLLMVQTVSEQQVSSQAVSLLLDSALESLRPRSAQNHTIFKEIQFQMQQIKRQILLQIPMPAGVPFPVESLTNQPNPT